MKFSCDAALSRIAAPHLLKQEQLQLAGASFRDEFDSSWNPYLKDIFGVPVLVYSDSTVDMTCQTGSNCLHSCDSPDRIPACCTVQAALTRGHE